MIIKVYSSPYTAFAANHLAKQLTGLGHVSGVVSKIEPGDKSLYIIYCANYVKEMPSNYILYQTEVHSSHWFSRNYMEKISRARAIWEYSTANLIKYSHVNIHIVTPGVNYELNLEGNNNNEKVLFYGSINRRRLEILETLTKYYSIEVVTNEFENSLWHKLRYRPVVVNLHYYENAPLEVFRINEALSFGCPVVSEPGDGMERYKNIVVFGNYWDELRQGIELSLKSKTRKGLSILDNREEIKKALLHSI